MGLLAALKRLAPRYFGPAGPWSPDSISAAVSGFGVISGFGALDEELQQAIQPGERSSAPTMGWRRAVLVAVALTVNFQTVGGLMIYSLISNPAAAAFQVVRGCRRTMVTSAVIGAASGLGGFLISAATDLPSGAVIVLVSSAFLAAAAVVRRC